MKAVPRTGTINQIRGFLIERGITVRQRPAPLRKTLNDLLAASSAEFGVLTTSETNPNLTAASSGRSSVFIQI